MLKLLLQTLCDFLERTPPKSASIALKSFSDKSWTPFESRAQRLRMAISLVLAAETLHSRRLAYLDFHDENILISADGCLHIIDWDYVIQSSDEKDVLDSLKTGVLSVFILPFF